MMNSLLSTAPTSLNGAPTSFNSPSVDAEHKEEPDDFASLLATSWFSLAPTQLPPPVAPPAANAVAVSPASILTTPPPQSIGEQLSAPSPDQLLAAPGQLAAEALALALKKQSGVKTGDTADAPPTSEVESGANQVAEPAYDAEISSVWSSQQSQSFRNEAARSDHVSIATMLAENSRLTRASSAASLKPVFSEISASRFLEGDDSMTFRATEDDLATQATLLANAQLTATLRDGVAASDARETARDLAGQVVGPIVDLFEKLSRHEAGTLRLRLHPDDLGRVDVQITRDGDGRLNAQFTTEHEAARKILSDGINLLRETLERAGISVERLDVGVDVHTNSGNTGNDQRKFEAAAQPSPGALAAPATTNATLDGQPAAGSDDRIISIRA